MNKLFVLILNLTYLGSLAYGDIFPEINDSSKYPLQNGIYNLLKHFQVANIRSQEIEKSIPNKTSEKYAEQCNEENQFYCNTNDWDESSRSIFYQDVLKFISQTKNIDDLPKEIKCLANYYDNSNNISDNNSFQNILDIACDNCNNNSPKNNSNNNDILFIKNPLDNINQNISNNYGPCNSNDACKIKFPACPKIAIGAGALAAGGLVAAKLAKPLAWKLALATKIGIVKLIVLKKLLLIKAKIAAITLAKGALLGIPLVLPLIKGLGTFEVVGMGLFGGVNMLGCMQNTWGPCGNILPQDNGILSLIPMLSSFDIGKSLDIFKLPLELLNIREDSNHYQNTDSSYASRENHSDTSHIEQILKEVMGAEAMRDLYKITDTITLLLREYKQFVKLSEEHDPSMLNKSLSNEMTRLPISQQYLKTINDNIMTLDGSIARNFGPFRSNQKDTVEIEEIDQAFSKITEVFYY